MDLRILIQTTGDNPVSIRRKHVMENLIGPDSACRCRLVESFIVIGHDLSLAKGKIDMMAGLVAPDETFRTGRLCRKRRLELKRLTCPQMRQDKMQFARGAGGQTGTSPLRRDLLTIRAYQRDRRNAFMANLAARHRYAHRDM